ncbi:MAG TPA: SpoIID/LytB domain-containing protein [Candidatus Eisenbergiella merdipullorum]|uniref:SpoIID/LytB domain-containing protein n=1 Tax=Candidatus Eisenbergiella merdipullorum TaxID=2838553 RepID=A0A9D2I6N7_9FIRM|nr:SpoIID/LytB domain-containing protein [Candidatus Eisenbergiella merdipullorum]
MERREGRDIRPGRTGRTSVAYHRRNRAAGLSARAAGYGSQRAGRRRGIESGGGNRGGKLLVILAGIVFLFILLFGTAREILRPGPEGEYLAIQEAENLTRLLLDVSQPELLSGQTETEQPDFLADIFTKDAASEEGYLTYGAWERIAALFPECGYELPSGYRQKDQVLLSDWYVFFDAALAVCDAGGQIQYVELTPIGIGEAVTDAEGKALEENGLISGNSAYTFLTDRIRDCLYRPVTAVCRDGVLYAVRSVDGQESVLSNIWIMEAGEDGLLCFWNDHEVRFYVSGGQQPGRKNSGGTSLDGALREQVADLHFSQGALDAVHTKTQKVSGRILRLEDGGVEVEGSGFLPFADTLQVYRLYGELKTYGPQELRIGYDFTDFVIEDGCVQAALVVKEETMENIRVLVRTSGYAGLFHESVSMTADCDLSVITGEYGKQETTVVPAGETLNIDMESGLFASDIIRIEPAVLTGRISLPGVQRSQGTPSYRGSLELRRQEEGIVVINELLLEEYLYAVVPSEMPSSYPLEALKAQAVCARTYAYARILHAGLPEYGAHVDDSSSFQVYNNILENAQTTKAVRETKGELLYYGEELADTFYYSTSCGYGTDTGIWLNSSPELFPYLQGKAVNAAGVVDAQGDAVDATVNEADIAAADFMEQEESFSAFIKNVRPSDFESGEAWYRWTYQAERLDTGLLYEKLLARYAASPASIFVLQADGEYQNQAPPDPGRILDLAITERNTGGVAQALRITGENAVILVKTEHNIRYVLCDAQYPVIRQDGSSWQPSTLLPSAFFVLESAEEDGYVAGFTLYGGGFGHGVGMSQNGARSMAENGCDCETILSYFYEGISLKEGNVS